MEGNIGPTNCENSKVIENNTDERGCAEHLIDVMHHLLDRMRVFLDKLEEQDTRHMWNMEEERIEHPSSETLPGRQQSRDELSDKILNMRGLINDMFSCIIRTNKLLDNLLLRYCRGPRSSRTYWDMGGEHPPSDVDASLRDSARDLAAEVATIYHQLDASPGHLSEDKLDAALVKLDKLIRFPTYIAEADNEVKSNTSHSSFKYADCFKENKCDTDEKIDKTLECLKECTSKMLQTIQDCSEGMDEDSHACDGLEPSTSHDSLPGECARNNRKPKCSYKSSLEDISEENPSVMDVVGSFVEEACKKAGSDLEVAEAMADYYEARKAESAYNRLLAEEVEAMEDHQEVNADVFASDTSLSDAKTIGCPGDDAVSPSFLSLFESEASSDGETPVESSATSDDEFGSCKFIRPAVFILNKRLADQGLKASYKLVPPKPKAPTPRYTCRCTIDVLDLSATGSAGNKKKARHDAAVKMLELLLQRKDDKTLPHSLTTFTPQELDEVKALSTAEDVPQNSTGKLRDLCNKLGQELPKYSRPVQGDKAASVTLHCQALGLSAVGTGNNKKMAKRSAAKRLLSQYVLSKE